MTLASRILVCDVISKETCLLRWLEGDSFVTLARRRLVYDVSSKETRFSCILSSYPASPCTSEEEYLLYFEYQARNTLEKGHAFVPIFFVLPNFRGAFLAERKGAARLA